MKNNSIAYIQFPGSNTENETVNILKKHGMLPRSHFWNDSAKLLDQYAGYVILGGFSFEDRSRSGIIASMEPVVGEIKKQSLLGKPVLGICNGAQILVESGLVPGNENFNTIASLADNKRLVGDKIVGTGYYNTWCYIKPNPKAKSAFIKKGGSVLRVPIAHAEGRFIFNKDLGEEISNKNLITYQYCNEFGDVLEDFPTNPNGSFDNAAAISNISGNVMAMMPHPERTLNGEADDIFEGLKNYISSEKEFSYRALSYESKKIDVKKFEGSSEKTEVLVSTIIADNEAASVEKCINKLGVDVKIKKYIHYEIGAESKISLKEVFATDALFNPNKEYVANLKKDKKKQRFLVRNIDDIQGKSTLQTLRNRFGFTNINSVNRGIVWEININSNTTKKDVDLILNSHIFANPISQECHEY